MRYEKLSRYSDSEFKRLVGVPRELFTEMVSVLIGAETQKKKSGSPHTLSIENQLLLTLNHLRNYNTQLELSATYSIAESNVNRTIQKVENALMYSRQFTLLKRQNRTINEQFNLVMIDVTENPIERPHTKKQRRFYSGKKKRHTLNHESFYSVAYHLSHDFDACTLD